LETAELGKDQKCPNKRPCVHLPPREETPVPELPRGQGLEARIGGSGKGKERAREDNEVSLYDKDKVMGEDRPMTIGDFNPDDEYLDDNGLFLENRDNDMDFGEYWQVLHSSQPKLITNIQTELDNNITVHSNIFCFCVNKCECKKTKQEWMLDSGASLHFTGDINDFVKYTPLEKQVSVWTANSTASIEGKGTIIIVLHSGDSVRINPVYYIPSLTCKLLSLGTFLQEEFRCTGNSQAIRVMKGSRPFLTFTPRLTADSIYVIKSMAANNEGMYSALASIYKIDYETIHNR